MLKKIIVIILVLFVLLFAGAFIFVASSGKAIAEKQINGLLKVPVSIGKLSLRFPLTVYVEKIVIGEFFRADEIKFSPNLLGFLAGKVVLDGLTITNPLISLEQSSEGKLNLPVLEQKGEPPQVFLTGLKVRNGKLIFLDKKIIPTGLKTSLDKVEVKVAKVMWPPTSLNTNFDLSAQVLDNANAPGGNIAFIGWIDFGPKNMEAKLTVANLGLPQFLPYAGKYLTQRKIIAGLFDLESLLKAQNNNLNTQSRLKFSHLEYEAPAPVADEEPKFPVPFFGAVKDVLDLFTDEKGDVVFDFEYDTLLDKPDFTPKKIQAAMMKAAIKNLTSQRPEDVVQKGENMYQEFKAIGKQFEDMFKKKKEE